jgi:hypothetical protein
MNRAWKFLKAIYWVPWDISDNKISANRGHWPQTKKISQSPFVCFVGRHRHRSAYLALGTFSSGERSHVTFIFCFFSVSMVAEEVDAADQLVFMEKKKPPSLLCQCRSSSFSQARLVRVGIILLSPSFINTRQRPES